MSEPVHVLVVKAGGMLWAVPIDNVDQTLELTGRSVHQVAGVPMVMFRDSALEVVDIADVLGVGTHADRRSAVIVWAGGRRRAFAVDELIGQMWLERVDVPAVAQGPYVAGIVVIDGGQVVPVIEPGVVAGAWAPLTGDAFGFSEMQRSALFEVANIGSGNAATSLSALLGRPVEISYPDAALVTVAEAADKIGSSAAASAVIETAVRRDAGRVLLMFPEGSGGSVCRLLGTNIDDEVGRSALGEVGNILASSYLNAIVQMTGMTLDPEPPVVDVDVLGSLVERCLAGVDPGDPVVMMRSVMTIDSTDAQFSFLFMPRIASVEALLQNLGLGQRAA